MVVIPYIIAMPQASVVLPANGSRIVSEKDIAVIAIVTRHAQGCERVGQSNFRV